MAFVLVLRFALWPAVSMAVVHALAARTGGLGQDPMLWFTMMFMPTGYEADCHDVG